MAAGTRRTRERRCRRGPAGVQCPEAGPAAATHLSRPAFSTLESSFLFWTCIGFRPQSLAVNWCTVAAGKRCCVAPERACRIAAAARGGAPAVTPLLAHLLEDVDCWLLTVLCEEANAANACISRQGVRGSRSSEAGEQAAAAAAASGPRCACREQRPPQLQHAVFVRTDSEGARQFTGRRRPAAPLTLAPVLIIAVDLLHRCHSLCGHASAAAARRAGRQARACQGRGAGESGGHCVDLK